MGLVVQIVHVVQIVVQAAVEAVTKMTFIDIVMMTLSIIGSLTLIGLVIVFTYIFNKVVSTSVMGAYTELYNRSKTKDKK